MILRNMYLYILKGEKITFSLRITKHDKVQILRMFFQRSLEVYQIIRRVGGAAL